MHAHHIHTNFNFKVKLFISVTSIFLCIALLFSFLFTQTSIYYAKENEITNSKAFLEHVSIQIEALYEQMNIAATSITKNQNLRNLILELNTSNPPEQEKFIHDLEKKRKIQSILTTLMFSPTISNVILYNNEVNYFYYTGLYLNDIQLIQSNLKQDQIFDKMNGSGSLVLYKGPHQTPWMKADTSVLSVFRNFLDLPTTQHTIVEIQVPSSILKELCEQETFKGEKEFMILDKNNQIIFPYDPGITVLDQDSVLKIQEDIANKIKETFTNHYSYCSRSLTSSGFTVVLLSNNKSLNTQKRTFMWTTLLTVFSILIAVLFIIFFIISKVTQPLKQLINHINQLQLDKDTKLELPKDTLDEFDIINNSLNQMLEKLRSYVQKTYELQVRESKANLTALQAKINPHFLYNAMNSISAASEIYGSEVTTQMCQQFSSMMRYVTSKKQSVTLIEELKHTQNYLEFMKTSNDGNFDYQIDISPELYNLLVPKLSIQPMIENCFSHAFKQSLPPWYLSIHCFIYENNWIIEITDNGCGFSTEAQESFYEFISSYNNENNPFLYQDLEINGLGIKNTYARFYILLQHNFEFLIENQNPGCKIIFKGGLKND